MAERNLLVLVGVPVNYRLGGPAFDRLPQAHPQVRVEMVHDPAEFARRLPQADGVILSGGFHRLTATELSQQSRLRWVQFTNAGVDRALTPELMAAEHVALTATKGPPGPLLAEHAVMLMLALARNLPVYLKNQEKHRWRREGQEWPQLYGKTIVILGVGNGGRSLARLCQAGLGMEVLGLARTHADCPNVDRYFHQGELHEALAEADFVVLCLPRTPATANIIDAAALEAMKPSAYLINVARGGLIDEDALVAALQGRTIAGAALDLTRQSPLPEDSPLWDCPNIIITPHIAIETVQISEDVVDFWCDNIRRFAEDEPLLGLVDRQAGY